MWQKATPDSPIYLEISGFDGLECNHDETSLDLLVIDDEVDAWMEVRESGDASLSNLCCGRVLIGLSNDVKRNRSDCHGS